jgi:hypothetical protein
LSTTYVSAEEIQGLPTGHADNEPSFLMGALGDLPRGIQTAGFQEFFRGREGDGLGLLQRADRLRRLSPDERSTALHVKPAIHLAAAPVDLK